MLQENTNTSTKVVEKAAEIPGVAYQSINDLLEALVAYSPRILAGVFVLFIFWVFAKILKVAFLRTSGKAKLDPRLRTLVGRLLVVAISVFGVFTAMTVVIPKFGFGDLIAGLGFTSFIIGFATKDILSNFLSGILVLWQEPFKIGDYVFVKSNQGQVEHIGVRATRLRMDDGERILIPNGEMYGSTLIIRESGTKRRMNLKISTSYNADIIETKAIIQKVLLEAEGVEKTPKSDVYVTDLASEGVNLSIYFWVDTEENSPIRVFDDIATKIKDSLSRSGITIYPPTLAVLKEKRI
jgi:small-conductance mechanosensitive channel